METVDVLMKMPKVEGYEYTGEFRVPVEGERYVDIYGKLSGPAGPQCYIPRAILRKAEVWKRLTLEVAMDFAKNREKITLRYFQSGPEQGARFGSGLIFDIGFSTSGNYDRVTLDDGTNGYIDTLEYLEK